MKFKNLGYGEGLIIFFQFLGMIGAGSGAVIVAALGNFLLSGILLLIAFGVFLRFKRRKTNKLKT